MIPLPDHEGGDSEIGISPLSRCPWLSYLGPNPGHEGPYRFFFIFASPMHIRYLWKSKMVLLLLLLKHFLVSGTKFGLKSDSVT